ncbi:MAG: glycosyltransferase family 4 protein [Coriobacteriia bacterium]|nr:glycosyltransferase family 4 protein [Coriobacteriia bacterium]
MKVFVEEFIRLGHDVCVLASDSNLSVSFEGYEKPDYVTFFPVIPLGDKTAINRFKNNISIVAGAVRAAKSLGYFDVVFATSPPLLIALAATRIARICRARLVFDVRDVWPDVAYEIGSFGERSLYGRLFAWIANRTYKRSIMITTVSSGKVEKLRSHVRDEKDKVVLLPNGLDEAFLMQEEDVGIIEKYGLHQRPICVYVGNVGLAQGLGTIFALAERRPEVRFLIFGEGAERKQLEQRAKECGAHNIAFCGTLSSQGVFTVLKHADVSFAPLASSKLSDSVPTKMFEAIGCGCPVLLAAHGDAVETLNRIGLGGFADPEDIKGLVRVFEKLLDEPFSFEEKQMAADLVVRRYSRQAAVADFEKCLVGRLT